MFNYDESDEYWKQREDMEDKKSQRQEYLAEGWEPAGEMDGVMTYRKKEKTEEESVVVPTASYQRLVCIQNHTGSLLKFMMREFIRESGDLSKVLFRHRDSFVDILEIYCVYVNDIVNFYDWMGLPVNKLLDSPTQYTSNIKRFLYIYRMHNLADEPLSKMINDIFSGKMKAKES